ncbi:signal transduction histidine kinase [Paraburkholderia sp. GAS199]|uniref:ATP-binding protein n=1 Tax=Paraburkholderia sp. GAS199 TaxID=3035126 RepID=UPI003D238831
MDRTDGNRRNSRSWWRGPRTLFARLTAILFVALVLAQALSFWLTMTERDATMTDTMTGYVAREVAISVALLDRLPADQRAQWLPRLARRSYDFIPGPGHSGVPLEAPLSARFARSIVDGIGTRYPHTVNAVPGERERLQVHLTLSDGSPLTIDVRPMTSAPLSPWLLLGLPLQLAALLACCGFAVRFVTRPLHVLAQAAERLGPDLKPTRLREDGPSEVAHAARAFNAMQDRIAMVMAERMQILAAISHDLQTPMTRLRLRIDIMDDETQAAKLRRDVLEMEALVKEGVAFARTLYDQTEKPCRVDPDALLDSLVCDYVDAGLNVSLQGRFNGPLTTRPQALRRIVGNLVDNALKFAGAAHIAVAASHNGRATVIVKDRGPGIPDDALEAVFQPFHRLEASRNRGTGGTGLGLAIARQLAISMDATLTLRNRAAGGLEARLILDAPR